MKVLTTESFNRARDYLLNRARPLEQALFRHYFSEGSPTAVLEALAVFQNSDGGFGRALEPDVRTPSSSALATGIGLRLLADMAVPADHPLVTGAVNYLHETLDLTTLTWRVVPTDTNDFAHAPWWHDAEGSLAQTFADFRIIPRAELTGLLHHYASLVPVDWLAVLTAETVTAIETMPLGTGGGDDLVYALNLAQTAELPPEYRARVRDVVREIVPRVVTRDPAQWTSYSIPPLKIAPNPDSPAAGWLAEDIARNLDFVIDQQAPEGTWDPVWSWGDWYPEEWLLARDEWRGELTLAMLRTLGAYGRLNAV